LAVDLTTKDPSWSFESFLPRLILVMLARLAALRRGGMGEDLILGISEKLESDRSCNGWGGRRRRELEGKVSQIASDH
jgi:hypothetical protein